MKALTEAQFVEKSQKIHGNKYDYSNSKYTKASTKVEIICPTHGSFRQRPMDHFIGNGCPCCKFEKIASLKRGTKEQFVQQAISKHGALYDYSKSVYHNAVTKVEIICSVHGSFFKLQTST